MRAIITVAMTAQTTDAGNDGFVSVAEAARATGSPYGLFTIGYGLERWRRRPGRTPQATPCRRATCNCHCTAAASLRSRGIANADRRICASRARAGCAPPATRDERREAAQLEQDEADRQTRVQQAELVAARSRLELARQRWQFEREQQRAAEEARADGLRKAREAARVRFDAHQRAKREEWCAEWIDASYGWAIEHLGHSEGPTAVIAARRALRECTPDDPADMVRGAITAELRSVLRSLLRQQKPRGSASRATRCASSCALDLQLREELSLVLHEQLADLDPFTDAAEESLRRTATEVCRRLSQELSMRRQRRDLAAVAAIIRALRDR